MARQNAFGESLNLLNERKTIAQSYILIHQYCRSKSK